MLWNLFGSHNKYVKLRWQKNWGDIDYHISHMNKTKHAKEGRLPDY